MRRFILILLVISGCATEDDPDDAWGPAATEVGWSHPLPDAVLPPPIAPLVRTNEAVAGAPLTLEVLGLSPGVQVQLLLGFNGIGVGPCHPLFPALCTDLVSPRLGPAVTSDATGVAHFVVNVPGSASGPVDLQAMVLDPAGQGLTNVEGTDATRFDVQWTYDVLDVTVAFGESSYDFGMAETGAGALGWYGEDCFVGAYGYNVCHTVASARSLLSVHPSVGGPGIAYVAQDVTTLFYDVHDVAITYVFFGMDSGECWAIGDDPSYYAPLGCTPIP